MKQFLFVTAAVITGSVLTVILDALLFGICTPGTVFTGICSPIFYIH